ncbi:hypothetical protein [Streptobacillus canis]|uniref:hypothetical protein n=1 Tax=Streptobacillus canis TaxID=2678686 RepID=UPI0018CC65DF|nr:hypothetical protein [Streptobacillus canis]
MIKRKNLIIFMLILLLINNALNMASKMIKEDVRFFFNVGDNDVNNPKGIIKFS